MDKVKQLIGAGLPITAAIKAAIGTPLSEFADRHAIPRSSVSNHLNGTVRATDDTIAALMKELGGSDEQWRELLWQAMRPAHLAAS
jgi:plasmid maintenance system antidote protein VapI